MPIQNLRALLVVDIVSLLVVAAIHAGILTGEPFQAAAVFETIVAVILAVGFGLTFGTPDTARFGAFGAQLLALGGVSVGIYMALRGMAPSTVFDLGYHLFAVVLLVVGLIGSVRLEASQRTAGTPHRTGA